MLGIVLPGIASTSPFRQSLTFPSACAISPGVSCPSGEVTSSSVAGRCSSASSENTLLISRNVFQSLFASHGGEMAALNGWTNGCRSVLLISFFSYHVAAGSTMSENRPELVIRKSTLTSKSAFPTGASLSVLTVSGCHEFSGSAITWLSPPTRCLTKNSCPLPLSPSRLDRQLKNTLGKFRGSSGFSIAQSIFSSLIRLTMSSIISCSLSAPRSLLSFTRSIEFCENCGYEGSQPSRADKAFKSAGCIALYLLPHSVFSLSS